MDILERVEQSVRERGLFCRGQGILIGVSGGLDSMVLLWVLRELSRGQGWRLTVAHLNHRLRGESSDGDEELVRRTAAEYGLPCLVGSAEVGAFARAGGISVEMAGRKLRHDFLARAASQAGIGTVALAHHADDQLELFFLRLLRGSGSEGLAGMKWCGASPSDEAIQLARPFLDLSKETLRSVAISQGIQFREDATNAGLDIQRNRVRHELLPLLRRRYQPSLDGIILRTMEILRGEAEYGGQAAQAWLEEVRGGALGGRRGQRAQLGFALLPVALQRRCLQRQLLEQGINADFELVERLRLSEERPVAVALARKVKTGAAPLDEEDWVPTFESESGIASGASAALARRSGERASRYAVRTAAGMVELRQKSSCEFSSDALRVDLSQEAGEVRFGGVKLRWRRVAGGWVKPPRPQAGREVFDADRVGRRIVLRHWRPGDRFQPIGMERRVKLQDLFTNKQILRPRRHESIIATSARGELFWVEGLRISERFKLTSLTQRRLQWRWERL